MALDKLTKLTSNSGISTVIDYTMSDLVVDSINIAGGGTTLGKDFETRNLKVTGLSTFVGNVQMDGNLTVNGTTTTLDTNLIGVDRVEVVANNNNYAGIAVTQSGTGDIISAYDGSTAVFLVNDGNKVGIADSIYHIGDNNTAIRFPAADTFTIETAGSERVRVDSSGNFGINTNNPTAELDVERATGTVELMLQSRDSSDCFVSFGDNGDSDIGQIRYAHSDNSMRFTTNTGERLRIDSNGNVGVGTISPNNYSNYTTFTINGTTGGQIDIESNSTKFGDIYTQSNTLHIRNKQASGNGALVFHTTSGGTSGEKVRIDSNGSLLFNQTQSKILVNTSDGSDSSWLNINGGGDASQSRGAGVAFYGNESSGSEGKLWLLAGNSGSANGTITMSTGGTPRVTLTSTGELVVGDTTYAATGSFSAKSNGEFRSVLPQNTASSTMLGAIGGASNGFNIVIDSSNNQTYKFHNGSAQSVTITDNGRLYIGTINSGTYDGIQPQVQLEGTNYNTSSMSLFCNSNTANNAPQLQLGKSRSGSDGGSTALQDDDRVGSIYGIAADGSDRNSSVGSIQFYVDGSVSTNQTPGSIRFATTASNASTPSERLRIDSAGRLLVNGAAATNAFSGGQSLIIGNASSGTRTGITLVSASNNDSGVYFSRGTSSNSDYVKGQLVYNHPNEYFAIYTGGTGIRLKIDGYGGHNIYNANTYNAANLAECDSDQVALNIRKTRDGQTKGIAIGAIGGSSSTGIQAYDSSDDSANELALNPYGGALLVGLTAPTYSSGDIQHEIKKNNSRTYTAPLMAAHSHLLLNNSDTTNGAFCGIGIRAGTGDGAIGFNYRGATNHSDFVIATDSGANGVEGFRIKSQTRTCSIGENVDPLNALHILDKTTSSWDGALTANRAVLRLETHWNALGQRAIGDYGSGIVFNHLGGHGSSHNNDSHAWLGIRVHDTPGYERSALVFATNDITASESGHDAGLKERMQINPHGQVAINYTGTMATTSHARLWVESDGINLSSDSEYNFGDNQGLLPHLTLAGKNSHVRLDMGTMDVNPYGGYIQARFDNTPDLGASDSNDGLEPLQLQPRGGLLMLNMGRSTTMPGSLNPTNEKGGIRMRAGTASSASVSEANTAIKIWPAEERAYQGGLMGDADQGSKYGGIAWLVLDSMSPGKSGWAPYDGNQCWMGMSLHSTPGQELGNWQLRMNNSGNQNSVANQIALQASPQGWVTKPNQPMFLAHKNSGNAITGTGYVTFGDQIEEVGGNYYDNSNGKFTAPIGGYYYIWCSINHYKRLDVQIRVNGSTDHTHRQIGQFNTSNQNGWWTSTVHRIFRMEKDEYVQVYVSNLTQNTDPGEWCTFGGYLIG